MIHARTLLPAGTWDISGAADRVVLPHDGRHRRRIAMRGEGDVVFLLDFQEATRLKHGDGLALDDGRVIAVVAAEEPVAEIYAHDAHHLARLAWHLGNRHVAAELLADRIRIARDPVLEEMVRGLGATVDIVDAAFEPEGGAYEAAEAHGHHGHAHHDHAGHEHGPDCGCGHDHSGHDHGENDHAHHDHAHHDHGHDHKPARDVLHVQEHTHDHGHAHEHGDACGCGHDHSHDAHSHDSHAHDHDKHDHATHGHGHRHDHGHS